MSEMKPARTVADLAAVTGLDRKTVAACIRTGELPGYRVGSRYVIPGEAFERFVRGEWIPQVRPIFTERITARKPTPSADPSSFITRRSAN